MRLYGAIGPRVDGDYFAQELASLDRGDFDMIHIRMNSPGGNVFQGMSIVSAILSMNTPVCVHIDGIAEITDEIAATAPDAETEGDAAVPLPAAHPAKASAPAATRRAKTMAQMSWVRLPEDSRFSGGGV